MITFIKSSIVTVLLIMFGISIAELLVGCSWKNSAELECKTSTKIERTCAGKGTGRELILMPRGNDVDE